MTDKTTELTTVSAPQSESSILMNVIAEMARNPDADADKLKQLVSIRNDELARKAKEAYDAAFVEMKPHLKRIENKHNNTQTKSKYAKLEDINAEVDPVLTQYGFASSTPIVSQTDTHVTVRAILIHSDKVYGSHREETTLTLPLDNKGAQGTVNKTGPHAIASSIKYCRRIALCAILNISTGDGDDKDGNPDNGTISVEQAAEMDLRLRAISDKALPNFLRWGKVEALTDIPAKNLTAALKALADMEQNAKKVKTNV